MSFGQAYDKVRIHDGQTCYFGSSSFCMIKSVFITDIKTKKIVCHNNNNNNAVVECIWGYHSPVYYFFYNNSPSIE